MSIMIHSSVSIQSLLQLALVVFSVLAIVQSQKCDTNCRGFASMEGGTIGGGSAPAIVVRNIDEFRRACSGTRSAVIRIAATIRTGPSPVFIGSNKSIIGEKGAVIYGGLEVGVGSSNVIIRALVVVGTGVNNAVIVRSRARKVWIDHCEFSNSARELVYIAADADLCTVSWNKFRYQEAIADRYACLVGDANVNVVVRVTLHDNYFSDNIVKGMVAVHGGQTHFVNNYSDSRGAKSGLGIDVDAAVLVEANSLLDLSVGLVVDLNLGTLVTDVVSVVGNVVGGLIGGPTSRRGSFNRAPYALDVAVAADVAGIVGVCANVNVLL